MTDVIPVTNVLGGINDFSNVSFRNFTVMNAEMNMHNNTGNVPMPSPWLNPPQNNLQTDSLTVQQVALNDQIRESETNLNAQHEVRFRPGNANRCECCGNEYVLNRSCCSSSRFKSKKL